MLNNSEKSSNAVFTMLIGYFCKLFGPQLYIIVPGPILKDRVEQCDQYGRAQSKWSDQSCVCYFARCSEVEQRC